MRILFIHSELGTLAGGGENFSSRLIEELLRRGHEIALLTTAWRDGSVALPLPEGVVHFPLRGYWNRQLGQTTLSHLERIMPSAARFQEFWKRMQQSASWRAARWHSRRFAARVLNYPACYWSQFDLAFVHGYPELAAKVADQLPTCLRLPGPVPVEQAAHLSKVQLVCANGDALRQLRAMFHGVKEIVELPIGMDGEHFSADGDNFRSSLGWGKGAVVVGYVGRLTVLKGVKLLAEAYRELSLAYPSLRLLWVGSGEERATLEAILHQAGVKERCHFAHIQPYKTLPQWYRTMDLLVMPSRYENFSNAILEAMGCGLPVIASRVGGNQMMIKEEETGWLFEPGNCEDLTKVLRRGLDQRHQWPQMGQTSRNQVANSYSWEKTAIAFEELMISLVKQ